MSRTIDLSVLDYKIQIALDDDGQGGTVSSNLREGGPLADDDRDLDDDDRDWDLAMDCIESLALSHACAGVDVSSAAYLTGLAAAIEAVTNHL